MARRAKIVTQAGCNTPGLAQFARHFVQALGPVDDVTDVSALLGRQGKRVSDPALRRRMISARIALLADDGSQLAPATPDVTEKIDAPVSVQIDAEPLIEVTPKAKLEVPTSVRTAEFMTHSLADVARLLSESEAEIADPIDAKPIEAVNDLAEEAIDTASLKAELNDNGVAFQPDPQINISAGPTARYAQATTRVMNVARESDAVEPPKKKKKARPKPSDPIDFSALAQLGTEGEDQGTENAADDVATDAQAKTQDDGKAV